MLSSRQQRQRRRRNHCDHRAPDGDLNCLDRRRDQGHQVGQTRAAPCGRKNRPCSERPEMIFVRLSLIRRRSATGGARIRAAQSSRTAIRRCRHAASRSEPLIDRRCVNGLVNGGLSTRDPYILSRMSSVRALGGPSKISLPCDRPDDALGIFPGEIDLVEVADDADAKPLAKCLSGNRGPDGRSWDPGSRPARRQE